MLQRLAILFGLALLTLSMVRATPLPSNDDTIELVRRDTWGKGQYTVDLTVYHSSLKPKLKQEFQSKYGKKFTDFCGSNPDFHTDKSGFVTASGVGKSKGKGDCSQKTFPALDLGATIKSFIKEKSPSPERSPSRSPSPGRKKRSEEELELFAREETWGKGQYTVDLSVYHSSLKPKLKQEFQSKYGKKFTDFCGSNPDFHTDKSGFVTASGVGKSKGKGDCSQKTFPALDLGATIKSFVKTRSPSPSPERSPSRSPSPSRKKRSEDFELEAREFEDFDLEARDFDDLDLEARDFDDFELDAREEEELELFAREETWGKGQYTVDLSVYHSSLKPKLKQEFQSKYGKKFTDFCGSNPDFHTDKSGFVTASGVGKSKGKGDCSQKTFPALDLGATIKSFVKTRSPSPSPERSPSRSPSPSRKKRSEEFELEARDFFDEEDEFF